MMRRLQAMVVTIMSKHLRIATRKSPLALWQAEYVKERLLQLHPDLEVSLVTFTTKGDKILDVPLAKVGGKGLFVKELEVAMLEDRADIAVHSMKDVPMEFPQGLGLSVICEREDPTDAFVSNHFARLEELRPAAGSEHRVCVASASSGRLFPSCWSAICEAMSRRVSAGWTVVNSMLFCWRRPGW